MAALDANGVNAGVGAAELGVGTPSRDIEYTIIRAKDANTGVNHYISPHLLNVHILQPGFGTLPSSKLT